MCCLNVWLISNTPETAVNNWLQYVFAPCGGRLSKFKLQRANSERKRARLFLRLRLTEQDALSGNVYDLYSLRADSKTRRHKTILFVIFLSPSEKTSRAYLKRGYNRFLPHRFRFIQYSPHSTVHSPELQIASWNKTTNTKCSVQIGRAQKFSTGQLTTKVA
jgi:hypothetical protein